MYSEDGCFGNDVGIMVCIVILECGTARIVALRYATGHRNVV